MTRILTCWRRLAVNPMVRLSSCVAGCSNGTLAHPSSTTTCGACIIGGARFVSIQIRSPILLKPSPTAGFHAKLPEFVTIRARVSRSDVNADASNTRHLHRGTKRRIRGRAAYFDCDSRSLFEGGGAGRVEDGPPGRSARDRSPR